MQKRGKYYDPATDPTIPRQVDWSQLPGGMPMQNAWAAPPPPDVATANQTAQTAQADQMAAAAQRAAAGGIQAQKMDEAAEAMAGRYRLAPESEKIQKQFKTADAIRGLGQSLNTGSVNGGAPNWAGGIANVVGAYLGKKQQDEASAAAQALGGRYGDIASQYFRTAPTSFF